MKVSKEKLVRAVISYVEEEMLPLIDDKATVIIAAFSVNLIKANPKMVDPIFNSPLVKVALRDDGTGQFDIDDVCKAAKAALESYGPFPLSLPSVPLLSIPENLLTFTTGDIDAIRKRIEKGD